MCRISRRKILQNMRMWSQFVRWSTPLEKKTTNKQQQHQHQQCWGIKAILCVKYPYKSAHIRNRLFFCCCRAFSLYFVPSQPNHQNKFINERAFFSTLSLTYFMFSFSFYHISITYINEPTEFPSDKDDSAENSAYYSSCIGIAQHIQCMAINQCNCRHDDFKLLIHLFLLVQSQWNAKPFGNWFFFLFSFNQIYRLIKSMAQIISPFHKAHLMMREICFHGFICIFFYRETTTTTTPNFAK